MRNRTPTGTLRLRGETYWAQWKHQGVPYAVSLQTKDPDQANVGIAQHMKVVVAAIADGTHEQKFGRRDRPPAPAVGDVPLSEAWSAYVRSPRRSTCSPQTLNQYAIQWGLFLDWIRRSAPGVRLSSQVTGEVVERFAAYLQHRVSSSTYNKYRDLLLNVFEIVGDKVGDANPWAAIRRRNGHGRRNRRRVFTEDEIRRIFQVILRRVEGIETVPGRGGTTHERPLAPKEVEAAKETLTLCLTGYHTGLRLGDVCLLKWAEVDLVRREITVVPRKTEHAGGEPVVIPIHPELQRRLEAISPASPCKFVMPGKADKYARNRSDVVKRLTTVFRHAGIPLHREGTGKGTGRRAVAEVGFHSFRHGWVSGAQRNGFDQASVQAIAGWSSPAMLRNYTHVNSERLHRQMAAMPCVLGDDHKPTNGAPVGVMGDEELRRLAAQVTAEVARRGM